MKTEEEIKEKLEYIKEAAKSAKTKEEKLFHNGRYALLSWVLEEE